MKGIDWLTVICEWVNGKEMKMLDEKLLIIQIYNKFPQSKLFLGLEIVSFTERPLFVNTTFNFFAYLKMFVCVLSLEESQLAPSILSEQWFLCTIPSAPAHNNNQATLGTVSLLVPS